MNVLDIIALRSGYFMMFVGVCVLIFLISCFFMAKAQLKKKSKMDIQYPAQNWQMNNLKFKPDPELPTCYLYHTILDAHNPTLQLNHIPKMYIKYFIKNLSTQYNICLIVSDEIGSENTGYNINKLITYINAHNLNIVSIANHCKKKLIRKEFFYKENAFDYYYIEVK